MSINNQEVIAALTKSRKYVADFLSHAPSSSTAREVLEEVDQVLADLSKTVDEFEGQA